MAEKRKLMAEMEKVFRKVDEGCEIFDSIHSKMADATTDNQKDKLQDELKKEIKKLQRLRDQIKSWQGSNEIKDKDQLNNYRRTIELKMEQFKDIERENKTKPHSKAGLLIEDKIDPKVKALQDTFEFLNNAVHRLNEQNELYECEIEQILSTAGKKKKQEKEKQDRVNLLTKRSERHKSHLRSLELVMRLVNNETIPVEKISTNFRETLEDYMEQEIDEQRDDEIDPQDIEWIYDDLNLGDLTEIAHQLGNVTNIGTLEEAEHDDDGLNSGKGSPSLPDIDEEISDKPAPKTVKRRTMSGNTSLPFENVEKDSVGKSLSAPRTFSTSPSTTTNFPLAYPKSSIALPLRQIDNAGNIKNENLIKSAVTRTVMPHPPQQTMTYNSVAAGVKKSSASSVIVSNQDNASTIVSTNEISVPKTVVSPSSAQFLSDSLGNYHKLNNGMGLKRSRELLNTPTLACIDTKSENTKVVNREIVIRANNTHQADTMVKPSTTLPNSQHRSKSLNSSLVTKTQKPSTLIASWCTLLPGIREEKDSQRTVPPTNDANLNLKSEQKASSTQSTASIPSLIDINVSKPLNFCSLSTANTSNVSASRVNTYSPKCHSNKEVGHRSSETCQISQLSTLRHPRSCARQRQNENQLEMNKPQQLSPPISTQNKPSNGAPSLSSQRDTAVSPISVLNESPKSSKANVLEHNVAIASVGLSASNFDYETTPEPVERLQLNERLQNGTTFAATKSGYITTERLVQANVSDNVEEPTTSAGTMTPGHISSNRSADELRALLCGTKGSHKAGINGEPQSCYIEKSLGASPLGRVPLTDQESTQQVALGAAFKHLPRPIDGQQQRYHMPHMPANEFAPLLPSNRDDIIPNYYPQVGEHQRLLPHLDTLGYYQLLDTETLFFIFYFLEGTQAQFMAAKALKNRSWRFHKQHLMWYQRYQEPMEITDEYEMGSYIYFDYEKWDQRKRDKFTFKYCYLEDKQL